MSLCKVVGIVLLLIGSTPFGNATPQITEEGRRKLEAQKAYTSDALVQMSQVFVDEDGNRGLLAGVSPPKIKLLLDRALPLAGEKVTEDNYSRSGSSLVTLRKKFGVPEMDILGCVAYSWKEITFALKLTGKAVTFPSVAAACAISVRDNGPDPLSRPKR